MNLEKQFVYPNAILRTQFQLKTLSFLFRQHKIIVYEILLPFPWWLNRVEIIAEYENHNKATLGG